ncbi:MAG: IS1 family transposase, partial [Proteobacteria bacterium]
MANQRVGSEISGPIFVVSADMWTNNQSIAKETKKLSSFAPPYCANPYCPWHLPSAIEGSKPFQRFGTKAIARFPYMSQRFRCKKCLKTFSGSFFSLQYRNRKPDNYEEIHDLLLNGYSGRSVAKKLKINEDTVRRRRKKLTRWALLRSAKDQSTLKLTESVAFDGLENFAFSQFDQNNLNHAVGRESYYVYDFNLSIMNRKGRMSPRQQRIKAN